MKSALKTNEKEKVNSVKKFLLNSKTALITGASSGIGEATATILANEGMNLVLVGRREEALRKLKTTLLSKNNIQCEIAALDASDAKAVKNLHATLKLQRIHIDVLVNNVGVGKYGSLVQSSVEDYDWMMNVNMRSTFLFCRYFAPAMKEKGEGYLIFIASVAGLRGLPGEAIYCASKSAQVAFAQSLDYEMRKDGVKVSVIAPGGVKTNFAFGTGRKEGDPVLDKMLQPEDVSSAVLFCLQQSEKSRVFLVGMRPMAEPL